MSEFEGHTKGPWEAVQQKHRNGTSLGWIVEHTGGIIGWSSYATRFPNEGEAAPHPISEANARLMAAAPDLLRERDELREALADIANLAATPWERAVNVDHLTVLNLRLLEIQSTARALLARVKP